VKVRGSAQSKNAAGTPQADEPDTGPEEMEDIGPALSHRLLTETFGAGILKRRPFQWYFSLPEERRQLWVVIIGAALLFFPLLGAVGLWDPWETHFAEVGRMMMVRHDWVKPWWEKYPFYSKPPLTMWLTNIGLFLSGAGATVPNTEMGIWADWGVRTPITLLSLAAIAMTFLAGRRVFNARVGMVAALACATMPMWSILARQATTDMPFVSLLTIGMCAFLIAEFDPKVVHRDRWLYIFYAAIGFSTLAKEIPFGFGIPGGVVLAYLLLTWDWALLTRVRLITGGLLALLIALPWVLAMSFTTAAEEEGETFFHRYWLHDNFSRLLGGVHNTSPDANFTYFIQQLGYGMYPWSALLPGALGSVIKLNPAVKSNRPHLFVALWALIPFFVVSISATKFHHYAFPCFPPLALLLGLFIDRLWREGLEPHTLSLLIGAALLVMIGHDLVATPKHITDMFTYNPARAYPNDLIADPMPVLWTLLLGGGATALIGLALGGQGRAIMGGIVALMLGFALYIQIHLAQIPGGSWTWSPLVMARWAPRDVFAGIFILFGLLALGAAAFGERQWFIGAASGLAISFACYLSYVHWVQLTPHWTQREILHTYFAERGPGEPLAGYMMNWKGETFYGKSMVTQAMNPERMKSFLRTPAGPRGRHWVITDRQAWGSLQQAVEGRHIEIRDDTDNKFYLVSVE
jgi:4-amino-4-deoxy-L-arabinose transferase-like glycosyltransferase